MLKRLITLAGCGVTAFAGIVWLDLATFNHGGQLADLIARAVESNLNARVEIGSASYSLTGQTVIGDLAIYSQEAEAPAAGERVLRVERASVRTSLWGLLGLGRTVQSVSLEGLDLNLVRLKADTFNLTGLLKEATPGHEELRLPLIEAPDFRLHYADRTDAENPGRVIHLPPLRLILQPMRLKLDDKLGDKLGDELSIGLSDPLLGQMHVKVGFDADLNPVQVRTVGLKNRLLLSTRLYELLPKRQQQYWDMYQPKGVLWVDTFKLTLAEPGARPPFKLDATFRAEGCEINPAQFPRPVRRINGVLDITHESLKFGMEASSGEMKLLVQVAGRGNPAERPALDVRITLSHLAFGDAIERAVTLPQLARIPDKEAARDAQRLAEALNSIFETYDPQGGDNTLEVYLHSSSVTPDRLDSTVTVTLNGVSAAFKQFPYRIHNLKGEIVIEHEAVYLNNLRGTTEPDPDKPGVFRLNGKALGSGDNENLNLDIDVFDFALGQRLLDALLDVDVRDVLNQLHPQGRADATVKVVREPGAGSKAETAIAITLDGRASVQPDVFPARIEELVGKVTIKGNAVDFKIDSGRYRRSPVLAEGKFRGDGDRQTLLIIVDAEKVVVDKALRDLLDPEVQKAFDELNPAGTIDVAATLTRVPTSDRLRTDLTLTARGDLAVRYEEFPLPVEKLRGVVRVLDGDVSFEKLTGTSHGTSVTLADGRFTQGEGEARSQKLAVSFERLPFTDAVYADLPRDIRETLRSISFQGSIAGNLVIQNQGNRTDFQGAIQLIDASIGSDGEVRRFNGVIQVAPHSGFVTDGARNFWGTLKGESFQVLKKWTPTHLDSSYQITGDRMEIKNIVADFCSGKIKDSYIKIKFNKAAEYEAALMLKGAKLEQLKGEGHPHAPEEDEPLRGAVDGWVRGTGKGSDTATIAGDGWVKLRDVRIWEVPVIFNVLDFLVFKVPDTEYLEEAEATFKIEKENFLFNKVKVDSPSVGLAGDGRIGFDGTLKFNLKVNPKLGLPDLFGILGAVFGTLKDALIEVVVEGTLENPEAGPAVVPILGGG